MNLRECFHNPVRWNVTKGQMSCTESNKSIVGVIMNVANRLKPQMPNS